MNFRHRVWLNVLLLAMLFCRPALALDQSQLLKPDQAFASSVERSGDQLTVTLKVADGYYVYRDRMRLSTEPAGLLLTPRFPAGKVKSDPYFGQQVIFLRQNTIVIPLAAGAPQRFTLIVRLQGCAEVGVCYPPYTQRLTVGDTGFTPASWLGRASAIDPAPGARGLPLTLLAFFAAGLGMAFTACMYPLLPILSALIAGQGHKLTRRRGFLLSLTYVQGLALTYTLVGVFAGLTGALLTVWLQQPLVILSASLMMVLFALSMFDVFSLQLPSALQSRLAESSNRLGGGRILTVFAMGALSALIIGPCVAPPLALALGYIGSTGNAGFGAAALYAMALGLGLPLMVVGTFGGHFLPKAGRWMNTVKAVFGVVMLALALQLAAPFLPGWLAMLAWAAIAISCAVFLHAFDPLPANAQRATRLGKALGLLLFLIGAAELVGVMAGADNPRYPLQWLAAKPAEAANVLPTFGAVANSAALDQALNSAHGRPTLLDFTADWCVSCKEMDATTWRDARVNRSLQSYTLLRADVTQNSAENSALLRRFGLFGPPAIILFDGNGKESARMIGYIDASAMQQQLSAGLKNTG